MSSTSQSSVLNFIGNLINSNQSSSIITEDTAKVKISFFSTLSLFVSKFQKGVISTIGNILQSSQSSTTNTTTTTSQIEELAQSLVASQLSNRDCGEEPFVASSSLLAVQGVVGVFLYTCTKKKKKKII